MKCDLYQSASPQSYLVLVPRDVDPAVALPDRDRAYLSDLKFVKALDLGTSDTGDAGDRFVGRAWDEAHSALAHDGYFITASMMDAKDGSPPDR